MKILALQLKRIGDLVLTTPALAALRRAHPGAHLALGVSEGSASLLPAIEGVDSFIVFGRGCGFAPWQQMLTGRWDVCVDFTGTDRSAFASGLSRARRRIAFASVLKSRARALAYRELVESSVRERHTVDHYLDLAQAVLAFQVDANVGPSLRVPEKSREQARTQLAAAGIAGEFALVHPGSARAEKFWLPERWSEVIGHLASRGLPAVVTCGSDSFERRHAAAIRSPIVSPPDLLVLTALVAEARLVLSCDTAVVHLAAAFERPQISLFGPTNPFHWRPRHAHAVVLSAAQPAAPLTDFSPRMEGAPMERISTGLVCRATDPLLEKKNLRPET